MQAEQQTSKSGVKIQINRRQDGIYRLIVETGLTDTIDHTLITKEQLGELYQKLRTFIINEAM